MDRYLYVSSDSSKTVYPDNNPESFTVHLEQPLDLPGTWYCGLKELYFSGEFKINKRGLGHLPKVAPQHLYVCTDIVEGTVVSGVYLPLLRRSVIRKKFEHTFLEPYYFKVVNQRLSSITVYVLDHRLKPVVFKKGPLVCLLHFKKHV